MTAAAAPLDVRKVFDLPGAIEFDSGLCPSEIGA